MTMKLWKKVVCAGLVYLMVAGLVQLQAEQHDSYREIVISPFDIDKDGLRDD